MKQFFTCLLNKSCTHVSGSPYVRSSAGFREARNGRSNRAGGSVPSVGVVLGLLLAAPLGSHADNVPSITFGGVQSSLRVDKLFFPGGTAVDAKGNVFVADTGHHRVLELPAGGGAKIKIGAGLHYPTGIAVDAAGNVFISDTGHSRVVKVPAGGGAQVKVGSGLCSPNGLAVDAAGDLFIADTCNDRIVKVAGGSGPQTIIGSGFSQPHGVAVDASGNVFVADTGNSKIMEVPAGGGTPIEVTGNLGTPSGVAVDAVGNLFFVDYDQGSIYQKPVFGEVIPLGSDLGSPSSISVDPGGNLFVADTNHNRVVKMQLSAVAFGSTPLGGAATSVTLPYVATAEVTLGTANVLTLGVKDLDYSLDPSSTCSGTLAAGDGCTIVVNFKPKYAGPRTGAVQLTDDSGTILASTNMYGLGSGPQVAFDTGLQSNIPAAVLGPEAVVVDGSGNFYIADTDNSVVVKYTPGGGQTSVGEGLSYPTSLALDGAGNLYIADIGNSRVVKVTPSGVQTTALSAFAVAVAVDPAGNVFIGSGSTISRLALDGTLIPLASGLGGIAALAVDGTGNMYVAGQGVVKISPDGTQTALGDNWRSPSGIAVDAAGDVFVADSNLPGVLEISPYGVQTSVGSGYTYPSGVAVDAAGAIYVVDRFAVYTTGNSVVSIPRGPSPTITFADTAIGQTSSDSPRSVLLFNIGNTVFTKSAISLTDSTDFSLGYGSGGFVPCAFVSNYAPGSGCTAALSFNPQSARYFNKSLTVTGNVAAGPLVVALGGNGLKQEQSITFVPLPDQDAQSSASLSASASSGLTVIFTSNTPSTCSVSGTTVTFLAHGRCSIKASQAGNAIYSATSVYQNLGVHRAGQTITFSPLSDKPTGSPVALSATASSGLPVAFVSTTPTACSISGSTANLLRPGRCFIKATQSGDPGYMPAPIVSQSFNITAAP